VPPGEWFCVACARAPGAPIGRYPQRKAKLHKAKAAKPAPAPAPSKGHKGEKRQREEREDEDEEMEDAVETGGKRKAVVKGKSSGELCCLFFVCFLPRSTDAFLGGL